MLWAKSRMICLELISLNNLDIGTFTLVVTEPTDLCQKLSLDSQQRTLEVPEVVEKPSTHKYESIDGTVASIQNPTCGRSTTPLPTDFMDPNMCYVPNGYAPYYYGGYNMNEWEDYPRYVNTDGVEMAPQGVYGDNGSLMYHHGYGYASYGAYPPAGSPVPIMGHDRQLYGPQHYQFLVPYYQPPAPPSAPNRSGTVQGEVCTSVATDQVPLPVQTGNGHTHGIPSTNINGPTSIRPNSNSCYGRGVLSGRMPPVGYQDPRFGYDGLRSAVPWLDGPVFSDGKPRPTTTSTSMSSPAAHISSIAPTKNHTLHLMGMHPPRPTSALGSTPGFKNRIYPNNIIYDNCGGAVRMGPCYGSNSHGWFAMDHKCKSRGRGNGYFGYVNKHSDGLNELNRGPRAQHFKNQKGFGLIATVAVKGQNLSSNGNSEDSTVVPDRKQYNREDFPTKYIDAKCFVIKSYSEDDIHKSIKYSVWASTPSGNKKLDAAYQEAWVKSGGCPVFLFFSVNTSGQFVGLAEMVGPVDFNKNLECWQQDKWNGCFPVKWHIVKDVPNSLLKHITLENNDSKPVTNSRDCQEIKFDQGLEMIKIFKEHWSDVCMLDDFDFYEARQKTLEDRKLKQQQFQKQVWDGKPSDEKDKGCSTVKTKLHKPLEPAQSLVDKKLCEEKDVVGSGSDDAIMRAK